MTLQLWTIANYLPVSTSKGAAEQRKLQAEYLAVRAELNATSSQDEFAKWARIRRQHDKLLEKLEATSTYIPKGYHPSQPASPYKHGELEIHRERRKS